MVRSIIVATVLTALAAAPASAKKGGKGHGHHGGDHGDGAVVDVDVNVVFSAGQRGVFGEYWGEHYGRKCPPGLAKKNNGCLPPGLAKKRYRVGHPLPREVVIVPVPPELQIRIGAPPVGYFYGMIDGDLVKLAAGTLLVVDALSGLAE